MVFEKHPTESLSCKFSYDGQDIEQVTRFKYLGLTFEASLPWNLGPTPS